MSLKKSVFLVLFSFNNSFLGQRFTAGPQTIFFFFFIYFLVLPQYLTPLILTQTNGFVCVPPT